MKKFPKFVAGQNCINFALYQGKSADKAGGCPLSDAKQVAAAGWCMCEKGVNALAGRETSR